MYVQFVHVIEFKYVDRGPKARSHLLASDLNLIRATIGPEVTELQSDMCPFSLMKDQRLHHGVDHL